MCHDLFIASSYLSNWVELTFAKTSGAVTRDNKKNWPIADRRLRRVPLTIPETIAGHILATVIHGQCPSRFYSGELAHF